MTLAMRSSNYNWDSHVLQTYNSSRNVCRFWRIVRDSERVRSMLPRVYIPYEKALPSNLKGAKITVNVQRLIKNVDSSFGLINIVIKGDTKSQKLVHYLVGALSSSVWLVLSWLKIYFGSLKNNANLLSFQFFLLFLRLYYLEVTAIT